LIGCLRSVTLKALLAAPDIEVDIPSQTIDILDKHPEKQTPLLYATRFFKGDTELLHLLLDAGALVTATDKDGKKKRELVGCTDPREPLTQ